MPRRWETALLPWDLVFSPVRITLGRGQQQQQIPTDNGQTPRLLDGNGPVGRFCEKLKQAKCFTFYPREVKCYTNSVHASVTSYKSGLSVKQLSCKIFICIFGLIGKNLHMFCFFIHQALRFRGLCSSCSQLQNWALCKRSFKPNSINSQKKVKTCNGKSEDI